MNKHVKKIMVSEEELLTTFGAKYAVHGQSAVFKAPISDMYYYEAHLGAHAIDVEFGDCVYWLSDDKQTVHLNRGPIRIESSHIATVIRGYMPENQTASIITETNLPYVNGCSSKQVFPPVRLGDPTIQVLKVPPHSSEQQHHIHPTTRVVYVLSGTGFNVVGMEEKSVKTKLNPGDLIVLDKFSPHHFETEDDSLLVLPLHIFSSTPGEKHHPMFAGTHMIDK